MTVSKPRRRGSLIDSEELGWFLRELARTGNMTLAAKAIGRPVRSMRDKKRRDPGFAARCAQALTLFQAGVAAEGYTVQRGGPGGRVQLRRASPRQLGPSGILRYLDSLAVTGNLSLAAGAVGRAPRTMIQRRHRDPTFAAAEARALATGAASLEAELVHSALAALGEHGEADWLEDFGPTPGKTLEEATAELPAPTFTMTADDALLLLSRHWRRQERLAVAGERPAALARSGAAAKADEESVLEQLTNQLVDFARREGFADPPA